MKILLVHNAYQQPGGEDVVMRAERDLLLGAGHRVCEYTRRNDEINDYGAWGKLTLAPRTVWAWDSHRELREVLRREKPDLVHFHNTFPLISPHAYSACRQRGIPVVQTLHNYRLMCPAATFFRNGRVCEECRRYSLLRSVRYACYRDSRLASAASAFMLMFHRRLGTWARQVDCFIALTEFSRQKFIAGGLPASKITVKPNFVHPDPGTRRPGGDYALFVGRLSAEKGLECLLEGFSLLREKIPLRIIGDGPLRSDLGRQAARRGLEVSFDGRLPRDQVFAAMRGAGLLVFPSLWYEAHPMTIIEAFACSVPVVASRLGASGEIITPGQTGLLFEPGNPRDLASTLERAWADRRALAGMGRRARDQYLARYTAERSLDKLTRIYSRLLGG